MLGTLSIPILFADLAYHPSQESDSLILDYQFL